MTQPTPKPKKPYSTFYFVMLVITSIGLSASILGLPFQIMSLPQNLHTYGTVYFSANILDIISLAVGSVGLASLWLRRYTPGIWLVIAMYCQVALSSVVGIMYVDQLVYALVYSARDLPTPIASTILTTAYVTAIILSITLAVLWYMAYMAQLRHVRQKS